MEASKYALSAILTMDQQWLPTFQEQLKLPVSDDLRGQIALALQDRGLLILEPPIDSSNLARLLAATKSAADRYQAMLALATKTEIGPGVITDNLLLENINKNDLVDASTEIATGHILEFDFETDLEQGPEVSRTAYFKTNDKGDFEYFNPTPAFWQSIQAWRELPAAEKKGYKLVLCYGYLEITGKSYYRSYQQLFHLILFMPPEIRQNYQQLLSELDKLYNTSRFSDYDDIKFISVLKLSYDKVRSEWQFDSLVPEATWETITRVKGSKGYEEAVYPHFERIELGTHLSGASNLIKVGEPLSTFPEDPEGFLEGFFDGKLSGTTTIMYNGQGLPNINKRLAEAEADPENVEDSINVADLFVGPVNDRPDLLSFSAYGDQDFRFVFKFKELPEDLLMAGKVIFPSLRDDVAFLSL